MPGNQRRKTEDSAIVKRERNTLDAQEKSSSFDVRRGTDTNGSFYSDIGSLGRADSEYHAAHEEEYQQYFSYNSRSRGHQTIANFSKLNDSCVTSVSTGTVSGHNGNSFIFAKNNGEASRSSRKVSLDKIFQSPGSVRLFTEFCKARRVDEGLLFWQEVESFQNEEWKPIRVLGIRETASSEESKSGVESKEEEEKYGESKEDPGFHYDTEHCTEEEKIIVQQRKRRDSEISDPHYMVFMGAMAIYDAYLCDKAKKQVCISSDTLKEIKSNLTVEKCSRNIFRDAQRHVFRDMEKGLFKEFLISLNHKGLKAVEKDIKHTFNVPGLATANAVELKYRSSSATAADFYPDMGSTVSSVHTVESSED